MKSDEKSSCRLLRATWFEPASQSHRSSCPPSASSPATTTTASASVQCLRMTFSVRHVSDLWWCFGSRHWASATGQWLQVVRAVHMTVSFLPTNFSRLFYQNKHTHWNTENVIERTSLITVQPKFLLLSTKVPTFHPSLLYLLLVNRFIYLHVPPPQHLLSILTVIPTSRRFWKPTFSYCNSSSYQLHLSVAVQLLPLSLAKVPVCFQRKHFLVALLIISFYSVQSSWSVCALTHCFH